MAKNVFNPEITYPDVCLTGHIMRGCDRPPTVEGHFEADTVEYDIPYINGPMHLEYAVFHVHESGKYSPGTVGVYRIPIHDCSRFMQGKGS